MSTSSNPKDAYPLARDIAYIAVFTALIWAFAFVKIPVGTLGVPITLQTFAIALTGFLLGPWRGSLATLLYVVLGLLGMPVFAGGAGGLGVLAKPTAGYIIAFPIFALLCGFIAKQMLPLFKNTRLWLALALLGIVASFLSIHPLGITGIAMNSGHSLQEAFLLDLPYWPGDILKNIAAAGVAVFVHRAFPTLLTK